MDQECWVKINFKIQKFYSFYKNLGKYFLTNFSNIINNQNLTDAHTCYKMFKSDIFKN